MRDGIQQPFKGNHRDINLKLAWSCHNNSVAFHEKKTNFFHFGGRFVISKFYIPIRFTHKIRIECKNTKR